MAVHTGNAYGPVNFSGSEVAVSNVGNSNSNVDFSASVVIVDHLGQLRGDFGTISQTNFTYRMRAFDTSLSAYVYWNAFDIDAGGVQYGGPGPLTGIVVSNILPL